MIDRLCHHAGLLLASSALVAAPMPASAQVAASPSAQPMDAQYAKLIDQYLADKRFQTDLVDHMPLSDTVPSPLKFFGRIPGTPSELTYAKDIERYYQELAKTSPRVKFWKVGTTEEGRDIVVLAIADEETLKTLDAHKADLAALSDPRRTTEAQAQKLIDTAKPLYWVTSGIHSPETGGPEMLIELAYRLAVEESPLVQNIRNHMITFITPVLEVDGHEKEVDTFYYGKKTGKPRPPLMYWGKYVAHDNNRDGIGQYLHLTQSITHNVLEWHPTILHDLHEERSYLYVSTGTGPYNDQIDPIASNEWWLLAETEIMQMSKRKVPGVWTWGFYDGWTPNYLFWIAITHNSFGRFYEVQAYGPDPQPNLKLPPEDTSREWFRPNPPLPTISWTPRSNTNIQESALLIGMDKVATDRKIYLESYWTKNKHAVEGGQNPAVKAWLIPAGQTARVNVADMVNDLRHQGLEISTANGAFSAGGVAVQPGDYIIRGDQPNRTLADIYLSLQNYAPTNPRSHDDTGWTMQLMRNVDLRTIKDASILQQPMTLMTEDARPKGAIGGAGPVIVVDHSGDNALVTMRFRLAKTRMLAAESPFDLDGRHYAAGSFIIPNANRAAIEPVLAELGLQGTATAAIPAVPAHELTVPRIGYIHSWQRTQDEGWWRAALDHYHIPYTYFADIKARQGGLRGKYDVIIYPTVGGSAKDQVAGVPMNGKDPIPYRKTALTPNLGANDSADDIRGGLGSDGLAELKKFVQAGGTLISDGSTANLLAEFGVAEGVNVSTPSRMYTQGSLMRGLFTDKTSPIAYGYSGSQMPIYFSSTTVLTVARNTFNMRTASTDSASWVVQNLFPNEVPEKLSPYGEDGKTLVTPHDDTPYSGGQPTSRTAAAAPTQFPRTIMAFPGKADDILLSGTLAGGEALTRKALIVDVPLGQGHMVLFGMRPFWRWQTQGSYFLGFNAILNWNHLDAGAGATKSGR
jgi:hypothetical protein